MALIPISAPVANVASGQLGPTIFSGSVFTGVHVNAADFVVADGAHAGFVKSAVTNQNGGLYGIAQHDSTAVYDQITTGLQAVFGVSQENTPLFPGTPGQLLVVTLGANIIVAINLPATTGWVTGGTNQANVGTQVGLGIDGTTGYFFADDQAANKVATIVQKVIGPGQGTNGDLASRVYVSFLSSALAIQTGH